MVLYTPQLHGIFDVTYPDAIDWVVTIAFVIITFASIEIAKYVMCKRTLSPKSIIVQAVDINIKKELL